MKDTDQPTPKEMAPEDVLSVLDSGEFEELCGAIESEAIEFKGAPYRFDSNKDKIELAKDISALANAGGGIIVMGVRTCATEAHPYEVSDQIRCFEQTLIQI